MSAFSQGSINITDNAQQSALTGRDAPITVATLNRDVHVDKHGQAVDSQGNSTASTLTPIFNDEKRAEINAGFEIVQAFSNETNTFLVNRAKEAEKAKRSFDSAVARGASNDEMLELTQQLYESQKWLPSGTYNTMVTAFVSALSGNVTGNTGQLVQGAAVNYLQSLAAAQVKQIADTLQSETARTALQAVVACAGAAASGNSCGAGAMGAASAVVISNLLDVITKDKVNNLSPTEQQARKNLLVTLISGITLNLDTSTQGALSAAQLEIENNQLGKNRQVQVALGYMLGVGASVGSLGLVVTPRVLARRATHYRIRSSH